MAVMIKLLMVTTTAAAGLELDQRDYEADALQFEPRWL